MSSSKIGDLKNYNFFQTIDTTYKKIIDADLDLIQLNKRIEDIKRNLMNLQEDERDEWSCLIIRKIQQHMNKYYSSKEESLASRQKSSVVLRQTLRTYVTLSHKTNNNQNSKKIEQIIKELYLDVYGSKIEGAFTKVKYKTQDLQILQYQQPESLVKKAFKCCCFHY